MSNIFIVGSFVVDFTVRVPRMPVLGEGLIGDVFYNGVGGKGTNQAIAARRLGARVGLLACVGDDALSQMALDCYGREGISCKYIHRIPNMNTGVGMVGVLPSGENWIIGHLGANMYMRPDHVDLAGDAIAHSDVVMTQFEIPLETMARAMELGRKDGAITLLNPAPGRRLTKEMLRHVDVLTPNESELRIILGLRPDDPTPTTELAVKLFEFGVKQIVVTRGREGALIVTHQGVQAVGGVRVKAVCVTGAGDCFNAAMAVGLAGGLSLEEAVRDACFAGAYSTQVFGVIDGLPTREQLETFKRSAQ